MKTIVEPIEIRKNNFTKWMFFGLFLLSVFAFVIAYNDVGNNKWIAALGIFLFGGGFLVNVNHKIIVDQNGFFVKYFGKTKSISWDMITSLDFDLVYHGHSPQFVLNIYYDTKKKLQLPVKQYKAHEMQKFFETLHQQCSSAFRNHHFIQQASGKMNWKQKLKML